MTSLPIGPEVSTAPAKAPAHIALHGQFTSLTPLLPSHDASLFTHLGGEENIPLWTYLFTPGWPTRADCAAEVQAWSTSNDPLYFTVLSGPASDPAATTQPVGVLAFLSIVPAHRRIEIGCVAFGKALQRTRVATEAFYLFLKHAFEDLGYRRVEWKANHLNAPSRKAAERLGFVYEGTFRKHLVIKGRSRDSAWFSMMDDEWPAVKKGFEAWLDESNFDENGKQIRDLKTCREGLEKASRD